MMKNLSGKKRRELRSLYYSIPPTVWLGKNGISEGWIKNLIDQLKSRKVVKIKFQKSIFDENSRKRDRIKKLLEEILSKVKNLKIEVIDIRGRTAILYLLK